MFSQPFILNIVMLIAGIGIPIMAMLNADLGSRINNPIAASVLLFFIAFCGSSLLLVITKKPIINFINEVPPINYIGGIIIAFYVLAATFIAPKIGLGNTIFLVLFGQILSSTIIDHFGAFGALQTPMSLTRFIGLILMIVGITLARQVE